MSAPTSPDRPSSPDSARFVVPDRASPPRYPQHFGPYLLLSRLARGGMGDVCLAKVGRVAGIERLCVVKSIRSNLIGDDEYVRRFVDEARTVVQLAHRNICPVLDVGAVEAQYYLAMELITGRDLRTIQERARQQQRGLPQSLVLHIVGEVLEALDYAHRLVDARSGEPLGIVHRDVSPQNVMVSFEGEVKLIDFGLAISKQKLERTEPGVVLGKLQYMSPEQARGDAIDRRTDVFATGVLLYELLVGERYYEGLSIDEVWRRVGTGTHAGARLETLPVELRDILQRAVAGDPAARFASCGELKTALHEYQVRRQQIGSAAELRVLMTTLFHGEEAEDRRARAELAATRVPPPREVTRTVRFAAPTADATAEPTGAHERISPVTTEEGEEPTALVERATGAGARVATLLVPPRAPRWRLPLALGLVAVAAGVALAFTRPWQMPVKSASTLQRAEAPAAQPPVPAPIEPAPVIGPTTTQHQEPSVVEPPESPTIEPLEKPARKRPPAARPAAPLPEVPSGRPLRVKYLAAHCRAVACAPRLVTEDARWRVMTTDEAREHTAAVEVCALRCHAGAKQ